MPTQRSQDDVIIYPAGSATEVVRLTASGQKVTGAMDVTGASQWQSATGGVWRDLLCALQPPASGVTIPVMTAIGASGMQMPVWQVNDAMYFAWHIPHDVNPAKEVYMHAHWCVDGTNVQPVKWEFTWWYASGYGRGAWAFGAVGTITSVQQAATGVAFTHLIAETAAITIPALEVDGLIQVRLRRVTNGGVENVNNVFCNQADLHYQAITPGTVNRDYPFT